MIPEIEFVKMSTGGMNFELRKKFEGMKFRDLYEPATVAARYEKILLDEQEMKNSSKGTYYKDPNLEILVTKYENDLSEVDMAKLTSKRPMVARPCKGLPRALMALLPLKNKPSKQERFIHLI